jgi:hypothetical protein
MGCVAVAFRVAAPVLAIQAGHPTVSVGAVLYVPQGTTAQAVPWSALAATPVKSAVVPESVTMV